MSFFTSYRDGKLAGLVMVLVFFLISNLELRGQTTLIKLVDSTRVSTDIINVSSRSLFTEAGSFNLTEIFSVSFLDEVEYQKKVSVARFLNEFGILIYIKDMKLRPAPKDVVTANRSKYAEEDRLVIEKPSRALESEYSYFRFGAGLGIDYGGIGGRISFLPEKHLSIFLAGGYALVGFGFNGGAMVKTSPDKRVSPYFSAFYGYNAAIAFTVVGGSQNNKLYNGFSLGAGIHLKSRRTPTNYWLFGLVVAFRSSEFDRDFTALQNSGIGLMKPLPVNISVGYHFAF